MGPGRSWLGVDFSGDPAQWAPGRARSNVWIARVGERGVGLALLDLRRAQDLPGEGRPFARLAALLAAGDHQAAGIDAPFGVPAAHLHGRTHAELLACVAAIPRGGRDFPTGEALVRAVAGVPPPLSPPKPCRETEARWASRRVNVRSALWAGARPGAPMAAACLTLLHAARRPVWPFAGSGPGLLVEAFPAAQLRQWDLPWHSYGGSEGAPARAVIVAALSARLAVDGYERELRAGADALDAVLCAFAAIAVTRGRLAVAPGPAAAREGWIAVHA